MQTPQRIRFRIGDSEERTGTVIKSLTHKKTKEEIFFVKWDGSFLVGGYSFIKPEQIIEEI